MITYTDYTILDDDRVIVTYSNGMTQVLGIYHWNKEDGTILCDDFETYIKEVWL